MWTCGWGLPNSTTLTISRKRPRCSPRRKSSPYSGAEPASSGSVNSPQVLPTDVDDRAPLGGWLSLTQHFTGDRCDIAFTEQDEAQ
jgi:hypothetical protein